MKYRKRNIVKGVSTYQLKENWLIHDSGKELRKHELYLNNKNIGVEGVSDYFINKSFILFNKWDGNDSFSYDLKTGKIEVIIHNAQIVSINKYLIYEDTNNVFHYRNNNFVDVFSSKYFFNILEDNYGITYTKTHLSKANFQDEILWQFPLSSLGGTEYEPGKTDKIDKILGIAHGNIWFYTDFGRLVALDLETGDVVKKISGNPSDKNSTYEMTLGLGDCFFRPLDKNIVSVSGFDFQIIDTEQLAVTEQYDFWEADPTGIGTYRSVYSPMLQGDYFTFLGEKEEDFGSNMRRIGIFDYKARKLVWEYELISIDEYEQTRNHLVPSKPLYMSGDKLYIKDIKDNLHIFERKAE